MDREEGENGGCVGDGSDSGLGSDTPVPPVHRPASPPSTADDSDDPDDNTFLSQLVTGAAPRTGLRRSSLKRTRCEEDDSPPAKRVGKSVRFDSVTVYYFPRAQGFTCVPTQGGSTLGMERRHSHAASFTLQEHALEQRRARCERVAPADLAAELRASDTDTDSDSDASSSESEPEQDGAYFLQPVGTRARRALLRAAGVRHIDSREKDSCRDIRASRELCGCSCRDACRPETCACGRAGISCQVDRPRFPCPCVRGACANPAGRVEFNPLRVQTHFVRTLVRLGLEREPSAPHYRPAQPPHASHYHYHSYSATSFEEFAHPTHVSMFNHYGHVYMPEYYRQQATDAHYGSVQQYASPSSDTLCRHAEATGTEVSAVQADPSPPSPSAQPTNLVQSSDNFGEIIKKTIVDTISG